MSPHSPLTIFAGHTMRRPRVEMEPPTDHMVVLGDIVGRFDSGKTRGHNHQHISLDHHITKIHSYIDLFQFGLKVGFNQLLQFLFNSY